MNPDPHEPRHPGASAARGRFGLPRSPAVAALALALWLGAPGRGAGECPDPEATLQAMRAARSAEDAASLGVDAARCHLEERRFLEVWRILGPVVESTARGSNWNEAAGLLGDALLARGLHLRSAEAYLAASLEPGPASSRAREKLRGLLPALEPAEKRYLLWRFPASPELCGVRAQAAEQALAGGDAAEALRIAGAGPCGGSDRAEARLAAAREGAARLFSADAADDFFGVGVLAPLSGDLARYGEALAQGVALAVREHNGRSSVRLGLRVTDTTGDPVRAAAAADSLSRLGVGAVIGDVLSSSTLAAAAALRASGTVLVSPAALEEGIGLVGPGIFQTIVPRHLQGRALADYAVSSLRLRRVAVIHDEADDSARLASAFRSRVRELGGDVVSDLEFRRGEGLFTSLLDEAEWAGARAVLAAGEPSDISELVTQLARRGGGMALLGSEVMGQPEVLAAFSDFDGDAAYVEDYYLLAPDREASFRERYLSAYGVAADRFARLGYVAGLVLAGAYEDGPTDRRALRERLAARVGGDAYLGERRIIEPPGSVATVAVYRITRGEVEQAGP